MVEKILRKILTKEEIKSIQTILKDEIDSIQSISDHFSVQRAKKIADILFLYKDELENDPKANKLYFYCINYYQDNISRNLVLGKDSMVPEGMCDLRSVGPLIYESIY